MLGAGTVINPIIKIVTTVAILGAVYLFIVKPTLDTTNEAFDTVNESFNSTFSGFGGISGDIKSQVEDAVNSSSDTERLQNCIQRAIDDGADQQRIDRCISRFSG
jgi:hypothetical protein